MISVIKPVKYLRHILILFVLLSMASATEKTPVERPDWARNLQKWGFSSDTTEQIIEAAKKQKNSIVRYNALGLLIERIGDKAIPYLREALDDPEFSVRRRAAEWLGSFGNKSGVEQMRKDFKTFAPNDGMPPDIDPNITDPREIKKQEGQRFLRIHNALLAAMILADQGDRSGYKLAAVVVMEDRNIIHRVFGVRILVEIAKADPATLQAEGLDPVSVLCSVAKSEKQEFVLNMLIARVSENLHDETALKILEIVQKSSNAPESVRRSAKSTIERIQGKEII